MPEESQTRRSRLSELRDTFGQQARLHKALNRPTKNLAVRPLADSNAARKAAAEQRREAAQTAGAPAKPSFVKTPDIYAKAKQMMESRLGRELRTGKAKGWSSRAIKR